MRIVHEVTFDSEDADFSAQELATIREFLGLPALMGQPEESAQARIVHYGSDPIKVSLHTGEPTTQNRIGHPRVLRNGDVLSFRVPARSVLSVDDLEEMLGTSATEHPKPSDVPPRPAKP